MAIPNMKLLIVMLLVLCYQNKKETHNVSTLNWVREPKENNNCGQHESDRRII